MMNFTSLKSWMLTAALCVAGAASAQTELLQNASFEEWNGEEPTHWASVSSASKATLSKSADARTGAASVMVAGANSNQRLAYEEMTLLPGTYTFSVYVKAATDENASACPGYAPIKADGKTGTYSYGEYVNDVTNTEWKQAVYTFTLKEETELCLVVMNPDGPNGEDGKPTKGADLLLDDASLTTMDGGIVDEPEPEPEPEPSAVIFEEAFDESLGGFTVNEVKPAEGLGSEVWTFDSKYTCAKATSYTGGQEGVDIPAESWLISPSIDLTNVEAATLTFDHACNYFNDVKTDVTVWVREGSEGEWVSLEIPVYPTSFTFVGSGDVDLAAYIGKTIQVGFKYVCTEKAGTYEVKNFKVEERVAEAGPELPENESSKEKPYSVAMAMEKYDAELTQPEVWVKGFIVGYIDGASLENGSVFGAVAPEGGEVSSTNLLIADNAEETDYTKCIPVQLPSGDLREALNLQAHPENLGKSVTLVGSLEAYFRVCGLKSVTDYVWNEGASVDGVNADVAGAPMEVYTLGGVKVGDSLDGLQKGIYIVKQGNEVKKVLK